MHRLSPKHLPALPSATYVVALSGGVDSVVLLDLLRSQPQLTLVVAHFNHGIRGDAANRDQAFAASLAESCGLRFISEEGKLGGHASEAQAREARYDFLERTRRACQARAIITAHHQDDVRETILINMLRGTGWRGLAPFATQDGYLCRPLVGIATKADIIDYALRRGLRWIEDETNANDDYLRNRIRHHVMPRVDATAAARLDELWSRQCRLRPAVESVLDVCLQESMCPGVSAAKRYDLSRYDLTMADSSVSTEIIQAAVEAVTGRRLLTRQAADALLFVKTARAGSVLQFGTAVRFSVSLRRLVVEHN